MSVAKEITPERRAGPVAVEFAQLAHEYGLSGPEAYALYSMMLASVDRRTFAQVWGLLIFDLELEA